MKTAEKMMMRNNSLFFYNKSRLGLLSIIVFIGGCSTPHQPVADIYSGYQTLEPPRSNLAVGAAWIPALGSTNGPGLPVTALSTSSTSDVKLNSGKTLNSSATLSNFLGLSAGGTRKIDVKVKDAEVVSVMDLADLSIGGSARTFVHSAVKVKNFSIEADSSMDAQIRNAVLKKLNLADGNLVWNSSGTADINGANLFVAYKTVSATAQETSKKSLTVDYSDKNQVTVKGFTLSAWSRFTYPCSEGPTLYWLIRSDEHMDGSALLNKTGTVTLNKKPSQEYQSSSQKAFFDAASNDVIPLYKGLEGNKVRQVLVRFAYDGLEVVDRDNNNKTTCRLVGAGAKKSSAELVVTEYTLESP